MQKGELVFSKMPLDRATAARKNPQWLTQQLDKKQTVLILCWRGKYIFAGQELLKMARDHQQANHLIASANELIFLGLDQSVPIFVVDLSSFAQEQVVSLLGEKITLRDFRASLSLLSASEVAILSYGKALSHWHSSNHYCGYCGSESRACEGGHMRKCQNADCHKESFPRTDPVVIMLVEHKIDGEPAKCLLAQHHRLSQQVVSTLAGFVDPGETLEEAVAREVFEEAGVRVNTVTYVASQPWPFPGSLMIGFFAKTDDPSLNIDNEELAGAHWFTAAQIKTFANWGDEGDNHQLPRKESIARFLIDQWLLAQEPNKPE